MSDKNSPSPDTKDPIIEVARINRTTTIVVAFFTLVSGIVVAFFASPLLLEYYRQNYQLTPTPIVVSSVTTIDTLPSTDTATQTVIISPNNTPTLPPATPTQSAGVMTVQINSNYFEGRAPFTPTFRAGTSFVTYQDGTVETCEFANVCSYSWDVREKNGPVIHGPEAGGGVFSFTFTRRGEYIVVVYVCRGQVCSYTAANVTVR